MHTTKFTSLLMIVIMSLSGCSVQSTVLDVSLAHETVDKKFFVTMLPPQIKPGINQIHSWQIKISSLAGIPVKQAKIIVSGGMPQHGHNFPNKLQINKELGDGTYLLEGVQFSTSGLWRMKIAIQSYEGNDRTAFNIFITPASK